MLVAGLKPKPLDKYHAKARHVGMGSFARFVRLVNGKAHSAGGFAANSHARIGNMQVAESGLRSGRFILVALPAISSKWASYTPYQPTPNKPNLAR